MLSFARVRALAIVSLLFIGAAVAVAIALNRDDGAAVTKAACPEGSVLADLTLHDARNIRINVYNTTGRVGLAGQVGENLANRNFQVLEIGDTPDPVDAVAVLRYGPRAVGAAHVLQAYFLNGAIEEFDIAREDDVVDILIGSQFQQLATETEVRQSIAALGNAVAPSGTCAEQPS